MIRINLLGVPKSKKGRRAAAVSTGEQGPAILLVALLIVVIAAAVNLLWYRKLQSDAVQLQNDMRAANAEYARLSQVKVRYEELEKQKEAYKKRIDVIDDLKAKQSGPLHLLTMVADTVNHTDEVWLDSMSDDGANINVKGTAPSIHAVADLMHNLQGTGYFKAVEIKTSYQDEGVHDMQAFVFELSCEKAPQPAAPAAGPPRKA